MRIARALALAGIDSRRKCEEHIRKGEVSLNGERILDLGRQVDPEKDAITFRGRLLLIQEPVYYLLFKPEGYVTTSEDPRAKRTVYELLPHTLAEHNRGRFLHPPPHPPLSPCPPNSVGRSPLRSRGFATAQQGIRPSAEKGERTKVRGKKGPPQVTRVFPVGRLDKDSSGLLLFTNDGNLANRLMHPRYGVERWYEVRLDRPLEPKDPAQLVKGIRLSDGLAKAEKIQRMSRRVLRLVLREGRNREVRRIFEALGYEVVRLCRIGFGPLWLGKLLPGHGRFLTKGEIRLLKEWVRKSEEKVRTSISS